MSESNTPSKPHHHSLIYKHPEGYRARRAQNWIMLGLTYASYYACRYNLGIVAPELKETLGFDNKQYGAIQGARSIAYAFGQFFNGLFTDKVGGKQAMTIGAIMTIAMNLAFGFVAWSNLPYLFIILMVIRLIDGYFQAFGAPGMIKINASWFRREERGGFAGIFGFMINIGQSAVNQLGPLLKTGFVVPLLFFTITVPKMDWRYIFIVPPIIVLVVIIFMNALVKNHPEEAGYRIPHDDEDPNEDPHAPIKMGVVFRKITSNPIVWIVAFAYFCTGVVRACIYDWWTIYMKEAWQVAMGSNLWWWVGVICLPWLASIGSLGSGIISDKLFAGRRAPVAALLYFAQVVCIILAIMMSQGALPASAGLAVILILGVHVGCNATHSILGTAAAMDLGGRRMAGFASGVIDSFQYFGAFLAGFPLGWLLDHYHIPVERAVATTTQALNAATQATEIHKNINPTVWFSAMLPWAVLGTLLMTYLWLKHRGTGARGT